MPTPAGSLSGTQKAISSTLSPKTFISFWGPEEIISYLVWCIDYCSIQGVAFNYL